jgi:hypothetical protein
MRLRTDDHDIEQEKVARVLEGAWNCTLHPVDDDYAPLNFYVTRGIDPTVVAWLKIKCRNASSFDFGATMLCNIKKYEAMLDRQSQTGLPVLFVVGFEDCIHWIDILAVDASSPQLGGRRPRPGVDTDMGLMVYVPISAMGMVPLGLREDA